jgi:hypothetical protein
MVKKFPGEKEVWLYGLTYYYKNGKLDEGRELFKESLRKLPKPERMN